MKSKHIGTKDLRFIVKALKWAANDRSALADAWGYDESPEGKRAKKESDQCNAVKNKLNEYLKEHKKGLYFLDEHLKEEDGVEYLTFEEIKERCKK